MAKGSAWTRMALPSKPRLRSFVLCTHGLQHVCHSLFLCTRHMSGHAGVPQCGNHDNSVSADNEFIACADWWELLS